VFDAQTECVFAAHLFSTWHLGTPLKPGVSDVRATLLGVQEDKSGGKLIPLSIPLRATAQMDIFERIALKPEMSGELTQTFGGKMSFMI
jgi:hypothetical protein